VPVHAGPASARRRPQTLASPRLALSWIVIAALAAAAWALIVTQARSMGVGPGTMGLMLLPFLGIWIVMMTAMMLPSVAPVVVLWARLIGSVVARPVRVARMSLFLSGYLLVWAAVGVVAFMMLRGADRLLDASPTAAKWLGVAIFAAGGVYELTPWKDWCLRHCRSPIGTLLHYIHMRGRIRDLRVGIHHGATCVACCSGLMIVLVAVGVMNVPAMIALAAIIFAEKIWRHGKSFRLAIGILLLSTGLLAIWFPWLLLGLHPATMHAVGR
jgi:predicted metal-binding membrane protein